MLNCHVCKRPCKQRKKPGAHSFSLTTKQQGGYSYRKGGADTLTIAPAWQFKARWALAHRALELPRGRYREKDVAACTLVARTAVNRAAARPSVDTAA
jgi:hypothetical protein